MAKSKFYDFVEDVINIEGGYVDNPNDSGGPTNYGITESTAREFGYTGHMRNMSEAEAKQIYKQLYWDELYLDQISQYSEGLAFELFDTGVNCGTGTAAVFLQRVLNILNDQERYYNDIMTDGIIGQKTLEAFYNFKAVRGQEGLKVLTKLIDSLQGARYVILAEQREKDEDFIYGWAKHRLR